jgi:lichenan operon transcriptional antiterminator
MNFSNLLLRQRKLLHTIQNQHNYITGEKLANQLQVSSRTIRNDINEINKKLSNFGIQIVSKRSLGYILSAENEENLKELNQTSNLFLTRDDRVRHIAIRLCLSDKPVNLYDLEDEMFISRTTLEHDLQELKLKYVLSSPGIDYYHSKNSIAFGKDERKRRTLLNLLFIENWNYNARGHAFYKYQYLEEDIVNLIMGEVNYYWQQYSILMEDINIVFLNLAIAIMYYRTTSGHSLEVEKSAAVQDSVSIHAVNDLLDSLEKKLACTFPLVERQEIYLHVSCARLLDASKLLFATIDTYFDSDTIAFANDYIRKIYDTFQIDFSDNEDFYITLLQYLRYLSLPVHFLNNVQTLDVQTLTEISRSNLLIEFEIAFLIQPLALKYIGSYLGQTELIYLAFSISGALEYANRTSPKLKTVIMCHLNLPASWYLKQKLLSSFSDYIDVTAILPIYTKDNYDFSKINLIITTANKTITTEPNCHTMLISPFLTAADQANLEKYIFRKQINRLYSSELPSIHDLFEQAFWHERILANDLFSVIELLSSDFIKHGYVSLDFMQNVLKREEIMSFVFQPSIVLIYSLSPSTRTCLSIATLEHRIKWNSHKIRTIIMAAIRPEDATLIFYLINELYHNNYNLNDTNYLKTREEIMDFCDQHLSR